MKQEENFLKHTKENLTQMKQEEKCQKLLKIGSTNVYEEKKMIQDVCKILGDTGCAAFAFLYAIGQEPELLVKDFDNLVEKKILGSDATVLDYSKHKVAPKETIY